jgi:heat shock protein HslJ
MPLILTLKPVFLLLMAVYATGCHADGAGQRYRGSYTLGHEVNTFCPEINSQCYWLAPDTSQSVRDQLAELYRLQSPGLYKPMCVIISGAIDRDSTRSGFAADYDGLITITQVVGGCESSQAVAHGDLQHHRWVIDTVDGSTVAIDDWPVLPEIDFGERLFVEGSNGCSKFSGFAELSGDRIVFDGVEPGENLCVDGRDPQGLFSMAGAWQIRVEDRRYLILERYGSVLKFRLDDWR